MLSKLLGFRDLLKDISSQASDISVIPVMGKHKKRVVLLACYLSSDN